MLAVQTDNILNNRKTLLSARIVVAFSAIWILSYYLLSGTMFERISPGGLTTQIKGHSFLVSLISTIATWGLALYVLFRRASRAYNKESVLLGLAVVIYLVPIIVQYLFSIDSSARYADWSESLLVTIGIGVVVGWMIARTSTALFVVTTIGLLESLYVIVYQRSHTHLIISGDLYRAAGTFNDTNALCTLMLFVIPFSTIGALMSRNIAIRIWYLIATAAEFAVLLLTMSRGPILSVGLGFMVISYAISKSKKLLVIIAVIYGLLCLSVVAVRDSDYQRVLSTDRSNASHLALIGDGWNDYVHHPLTGSGINTFRQNWVTKLPGRELHNTVDEPKNLLVYLLAERGIAGGILFCMFLFTLNSTIKRSLPSSLATVTGVAWVALLALGIVDTPFGPVSRFVGNCCFGILIGISAYLSQELGEAHHAGVGDGVQP